MQRLCMLYDSALIGQIRETMLRQGICASSISVATPNMPKLVATGPPNARNVLRPTKLWYVALKYCDRLAGA